MRTVGVFVVAAVAAMGQQESDLILNHTFETDAGGWTAMGKGGAVRLTHDAGQARLGNGALAFSYELAPKQFAGAVLPVPPEFARAQRLRFWARTDHDTAVGVLLSEKKPGGGDYSTWFWAPANTWQQIELTPADFSANDGPQEPIDADGKLDLDAVQGIAIFDLGFFLGALPENADFPMVVKRASGLHTLWLDEFQVMANGAARRRVGEIDSFDRGFLEWITFGGMNLKWSATGNPLGAGALEASYQQTDGQFTVLARRLGNLDLSKATRLEFDIASEHEAMLVISLETKAARGAQGPRYNLTIYPPGGREVFHVSVKLADFEGPGNLDPAKFNTMLMTDISAAGGGATTSNTIWIGKVRAPAN